MATVPTPKTWATGDDITAAALNAGVRDPLQFLLNSAPFAALTQSVAQAGWAASTWNDITFDVETADTDNQHSTSTNTARVNIGTTLGYYLVIGSIAWGVDNTGSTRRARIAKNGTGVKGSQSIMATAHYCSVPTVGVVVQSTLSTDYITLQGWHDATSSLGTDVSADFAPMLTVYYIRTP